MPRIRNTESFTAAAVSDTAVVAATQQRGPLHTASQGPLAPAAVFETAAVAATPVTVFDTVAVPCLKKTLKYPASTVQRDLLVVDDDIGDALRIMEKQTRAFYKKFLRFWYLNPSHRQQWLVLAQAFKNGKEISEQWKGLLRMARDSHVALFYSGGHNAGAVVMQRTVSFNTVAKRKYFLSEEERVFKLEGKRDRFPHREFDNLRPLPSHLMRVGNVTARMLQGSSRADDYHKEWIDNGHKQALALEKQPLPRTAVSDTAATAAQSTQSDVVDTSISAVRQSSPSVVSDTTATASQSTQWNDVVDTSVARGRQNLVVFDTTAAAPQSTQVNDVVDTSFIARGRQNPVVSDTTAAAPQSTQLNDVVDTSFIARARPNPVVSDTTAAAESSTRPPLRRSTRIAAAAARPQSGSRTVASTRVGVVRNRNRAASTAVRRTTPRQAAVKPQGFYKV